jgi:hypothetical protein
MQNRTLKWSAGALASASALLVGAGLAQPAATVPEVQAQATQTVTVTATTTTATPTAASTTTTATAIPTATATATQVPPTATPTTIPPTQAPTQATNAPISLTLTGAQEVPPVTTTGTGAFRATGTSSALAYTLSASGLTSNVTAAHIHSGARGVNGPIVANIITSTTGTNSVNVSGTITASDLVGPMAGNLTAFMDALRAGTLYVNVHTTTNPGGEVRAQFPSPPSPPATGTSADDGEENQSGLIYLTAALTAFGALIAGAAAISRRK